MKLSIVIVNYNVEFFLEQCLLSVEKAIRNISAEVFVVDNNSTDGSLQMLARKFPWVKVMANKENVGFARANNQAIKVAQGEYVLLLNPDTVVQEDTFEKSLLFMDEHPDGGGLGVKMVNGKGDFLPESKRGLPVPSVAFYKIFGLSKFFPKSKKFGTYHLTYLDNDQVHSVEVLSGAFMLMRKTVLDDIGGLDEDYFMYGEDIDLSYMILQKGFKNYYFPHTQIIHYKGESTKKGSLNYVLVFYRAMQIFAKKHFSQKNAGIFNLLIDFAIWFRAFLAILSRLFKAMLLPMLDFIAIFAGLFAIAKYWENAILIPRASAFPSHYFQWILPLYTLFWLIFIAVFKGYKKPIRLSKNNQGVVVGSVFLFLVYAVLPETLRFSRAVLIFGTMWTAIATNSVRYLLHKLKVKDYQFSGSGNGRILVVGNAEEANRVRQLVQMTSNQIDFLRVVACDENNSLENWTIGEVSRLKEWVGKYKIQEVVFCAADISTTRIIEWMSTLHDMRVEFRIAPEGSTSIIGSSEIKTSEDLLLKKI
ncbi:MAG: glycosyltransferase family 2 protein [Bacteroidales bacterium]|nr:glycosyltransferase family 2 protein [Bacteroidales bacterium]